MHAALNVKKINLRRSLDQENNLKPSCLVSSRYSIAEITLPILRLNLDAFFTLCWTLFRKHLITVHFNKLDVFVIKCFRLN